MVVQYWGQFWTILRPVQCKADFVKTVNSHWLQLYFTPRCLEFLPIMRLHSLVVLCLHWSQLYFIPRCLDWLCFVRLLCVVALCSHWSAITYSKVFKLFMFSEITLMRSFIFAIITADFYSKMFDLLMPINWAFW